MILQSSYLKAKYNKSYQTNYIINKLNCDVLIFGASRATHHYIPFILSDSLKSCVYNCGYDGKCIYYHYGLLMKIKERYCPQVVILDLSPSDIFFSQTITIEGVKALAPYYGSNKDLDTLINLISPFEKYKMMSMLYRYNSRVIETVGDNCRKADYNWENGYVPLEGQMNPATIIKRHPQAKKSVEETKIAYLEKFILFCKQHDISIFISLSPTYYACEHQNGLIIVNDIAGKYDVPIFNHFCNPLFTENNYFFKDATHLNHEGATVYSSIIGKEIKSYLHDNE